MKLKTTYYKSPIGTAKIEGNIDGITSITVIDEVIETSKNIPTDLQDCVLQLDEFFKGNRKNFNLKLNPKGTEFQKKVWEALQNVPYGKTRTYLEQSKVIGNVKAIRAVASANGKNPIWIVIPCHRIIGTDGSLIGYAGGLWRKKWLLEHENPTTQQSLF
ncbi:MULTISPECIES: methylated-DNA--[protein]-cysteine S-methyltransferase [Flavobacteriaceae]|uniref:Methylated-DNA--protein-cysteine methyltransferase n=2 Tax=Flavobacteriaceae TaxID=49546 RepID=A0A4Y8AR59_9FLAO|nr:MULTISPECIES: methylated-DNA--[protein]-cysteine S-methyltransferase [Flavobacteriaceae]TEW73644.1 methylated-DNA--[protein]-cysteine S-methyltransferase [Gramella jeungdoensis]GGK36359.1 methylated-DNA--protein-cysteine methyltransferase [Lutibacter litoralis]